MSGFREKRRSMLPGGVVVVYEHDEESGLHRVGMLDGLEDVSAINEHEAALRLVEKLEALASELRRTHGG